MNEKEAIERVEKYIKSFNGNALDCVAIGTVLTLLEKKDKEIEYYKNQKRYDEQFKHELLEKIRCKSITIDSLNKILDDRLICIQGGRGLYTKLKGLDKEYLIREYLSMYKTCKQELKKKDKETEYWKNGFERELESNRENIIEIIKKDKIIDLMAEWIEKHTKYYDEDGCYCEVEKDICNKNIECDNCIKQYFEKKVEE